MPSLHHPDFDRFFRTASLRALSVEHRAAAQDGTNKLPDQAVSLLASVLEERRQLRAQCGVEQRGREEALARRDQIDERIAELDGDALARVEQDIGLVWTGWNPAPGRASRPHPAAPERPHRREDELTLFATPPTPGLRRGLWVAGCGLAA